MTGDALNGSLSSGNLTSNTTYVFSCTGDGGSAATSTTITISSSSHKKPIYDLTATTSAPSVFSSGCTATIKLPTNTSGYLYNIYQNGGMTPINSVGLTGGTEYLDNTLSANGTYYYQIQLVTTDTSGNIHESASSTASVSVTAPSSCTQTQQTTTNTDTTSGASCLVSQTNGPTNTNDIYVNKQVTFTNPAVSELVSPFTTIWSSTKTWNGQAR